MKKKFKAKVSGMFDIVQLGDDTFSEVVDKLKANKDIHYRNQCLVIKRFPSSSVATNYVPDWNDMFAKDWMVL